MFDTTGINVIASFCAKNLHTDFLIFAVLKQWLLQLKECSFSFAFIMYICVMCMCTYECSHCIHLDMYFVAICKGPFDPLLLNKMHEVINVSYVTVRLLQSKCDDKRNDLFAERSATLAINN